jgi:hypothetical protein
LLYFFALLNKKTNITARQKITFFITFIFIIKRAGVIQNHNMTPFLNYAKHRFVMPPLQNPPLCSGTKKSSIGVQILEMAFLNGIFSRGFWA